MSKGVKIFPFVFFFKLLISDILPVILGKSWLSQGTKTSSPFRNIQMDASLPPPPAKSGEICFRINGEK